MVARGELGYHAPVGLMHGYLAVYLVRQETAACAVVEPDARLVTRGLDT
jgi:tRNA A22 N-methylase